MPSLSINLLRQVSGVGASTVQNFIAAGFDSLESLEGATLDQLTAVPGVGPATAQAILDFLANVGKASEAIQSYRIEAILLYLQDQAAAAGG